MYHRQYLLLLPIIYCLFACSENPSEDHSSLQNDNGNSQDSVSIQKDISKVILFKLSGDFDGDGKQEELNENFVSSINNEAIDLNLKLNYADLVDSIISMKPKSFLSSENSNVPDLVISEEAQQLGLLYLKNEGDLNGDGGDELSFMVNNADQSAINFVILMTLKKGSWEILMSFETREDLLPLMTAEVQNTETFFDSVHFIKKIKTNLLRVCFFNEQGLEEYKEVNLNEPARKTLDRLPLEQRFIVVGDSVTIPEFSIDYKFDKEVKALLASNKESLVVNVIISTPPVENMDPAAQVYYNDYETELLILNKDITANKEGILLFDDLKISKLAMENIETLNFMVTLNSWSGRKSSENNIFTADEFISGNINDLRGKKLSNFIRMLE